jgi:hypothetical protein
MIQAHRLGQVVRTRLYKYTPSSPNLNGFLFHVNSVSSTMLQQYNSRTSIFESSYELLSRIETVHQYNYITQYLTENSNHLANCIILYYKIKWPNTIIEIWLFFLYIKLERARSKSEVRLDDLDSLGEDLFSLLSRDAGVDNNIITLLPVTRSSDTVLITELKRVNDAKDFVKVATSRSGVGQDKTNGLLGVNDEDGTDSEGNSLLINVGDILIIDNTVRLYPLHAIILLIRKLTW